MRMYSARSLLAVNIAAVLGGLPALVQATTADETAIFFMNDDIVTCNVQANTGLSECQSQL